MRGTRGEWGAVFDLADEFGWTVVHPVASFAQPGGPVTTQAFEHFSEIILDALRRNMPFDGILLPMHGAMVVDDFDDAEGELLARIRAALRHRLHARNRALTASALKPQGLPPARLGQLAEQFARGGLDFIKDDHGLADDARRLHVVLEAETDTR